MKQATSFTNKKKEINNNKAVEWEITKGSQKVGSVCLELENQEYCDAPCVQVNLENQESEELYIEAFKHSIKHAYCNVPCEFLYTRYPLTDTTLEEACRGLGFEKDGDQYDYDGAVWQNMKLAL
jgi:hypothetical protein